MVPFTIVAPVFFRALKKTGSCGCEDSLFKILKELVIELMTNSFFKAEVPIVSQIIFFLIKKNDYDWADPTGLEHVYGPLVAPLYFLGTYEVPSGTTSRVKGCFPLGCMIIVFGDLYSRGPRNVFFRKSTETIGTSAFKRSPK